MAKVVMRLDVLLQQRLAFDLVFLMMRPHGLEMDSEGCFFFL